MKKGYFTIIVLIILLSFTACSKEENNNHEKASTVIADDYKLAIKNYEEGNLEEAKELLNSCLERDKGEGKYNLALGTIFLKEEDYDNAVAQYEIAIEKSPEYIASYNNIAGIKILQKNFGEALDFVNKGLSVSEDDSELLFKKAQLIYVKKEYKEAIDIFNKIKGDSKYFEAYRFLGYSYLSLEDNNKALESFKTYLDSLPEHAKTKKEVQDIHNIVKDLEN